MDGWSTAFHIIILGVMLFGLGALVIPGLPGLVIIWAAALVYGLVTGFIWQSGLLFAAITILMVFGSLVDNLIMGAGAKKYGASLGAIAAATVLGLTGSVILPPFGGLVAALLGIFAIEYYRLRDWRKAADSAKGMALGCGWSAVARFVLGAVMVLLWAAWTRLL